MSEPVSAEIAAAITAAVTIALQGRTFRIRTIRFAAGTAPYWSLTGRQLNQISHNVERKV